MGVRTMRYSKMVTKKPADLYDDNPEVTEETIRLVLEEHSSNEEDFYGFE